MPKADAPLSQGEERVGPPGQRETFPLAEETALGAVQVTLGDLPSRT